MGSCVPVRWLFDFFTFTVVLLFNDGGAVFDCLH